MKKQILFIHGGDTFEKYEDYLEKLKNKEFFLEDIKREPIWKDYLQENLGDDFEVLKPNMPNGKNAQYSEWVIMFEKIIPLLDNEVILMGHSLGGTFLMKYLSENKIKKEIKSLFLIAPTFEDTVLESLASFRIENSLNKVGKQCDNIFLYHSKDDSVVPFGHSEKFKKEISEIKLKTFEERGHFLQKDFPEITGDLKNIE